MCQKKYTMVGPVERETCRRIKINEFWKWNWKVRVFFSTNEYHSLFFNTLLAKYHVLNLNKVKKKQIEIFKLTIGV